MRIDFGKDWVDFVVESDEDLYVAYLIISPGDLIYGWTTREFRGGDGSRGERVKVYVGLRVESLEYHAFRGTLRVRGVLVEVPEWFEGAKGSHHTMELAYGLTYRLIKQGGVDKDVINAVLRLFTGSSPRVLLISISMDELAVAFIRRFGREILGSRSLPTSGKGQGDSLDRFRRALRDSLTGVVQWIQSLKPTHLVVVGNHMALEISRAVINEELGKLGLPIIYHEQGEGGLAGIFEFERTGYEVMRKLSIDMDQGIIDEAFRRLGSGGSDVALGLQNVEKALEMGAVDSIAVLDEFFKEHGDEMRRITALAIRTRARLVIVPSMSNAGERLNQLGGIIALLRFPI
ncbi:pelota family protein [Vulcanisaeta thermophila]|uniref:pelota family protein n=1 Tax=Vulcanisaeta thermophila TaxID=867917 RepID=UPI000852ACC6|nr:pelota family protein [Vulcanisaeta thermophila]